MLRKYFFTGLAILLPIALTLWILALFINLLTAPFLGLAKAILNYYGLLNSSFLFLSEEQVLNSSSKFLILVFFVTILWLVGFLGRVFLLRWLGRFGDYILHRIPLFNKIYKAVQDVVHSLAKEKGPDHISSVLLVPFPFEGTYCFGFITEGNLPQSSNVDADRISVFVPGTPNPMMGFMLLFNRNQVIPINMSVDEAMKFIISCGTLTGNNKIQI